MKHTIDPHQILKLLEEEYGKNITTDLVYEKDWQLLIAVILSAQNTDKNVNNVTRVFFNKHKTLEDIDKTSLSTIEKDLYSTGYYKSKSKYIKESAHILLKEFNGMVPDKIDELLTLPGVGRKTANVILGVLYNNANGVVVDTHVTRVAYRIGITDLKNNSEKIEQDLNKKIPKEKWEVFSLYLINHGRKYCTARNPKCKNCPLNKDCLQRIDR